TAHKRPPPEEHAWGVANLVRKGKSITSCPQSVSVPLTGLERMLSSSLNMDLYLKRFHLSDSDYCSCGGIGTALCH
ncbi:hypothetical protein AVEN_235128-1, partial [Araneus ventricosus]